MIEAPRMSLARLPTPLEPLDRLSSELGGPRIWLKRDDLTDTAASGNKLRKLEFVVAAALAEQADVLITAGGVQSNHCRATAIVAARLGLSSHLVLRGRPQAADGNLLLDQMVGAGITFANAAEFDNLDATFEQIAEGYRRQGRRPYCIPVGASDETGLWGYIEAARELKADFGRQNIRPGYLVSAAGSGGTLGGLVLGSCMHGLETQMFAFNVCDDAEWFIDKISRDFERWENRYQPGFDTSGLAINVIDGYVGPGYARADAHVFDTIRHLARLEGVLLDPVYTGKAFDAMLTEIKAGRFADTTDIVFLHTGGIFGLFPQRSELV